MRSVYLDSSVFVTVLLKNRDDSTVAKCRSWLMRAARNEVRAVTSRLTWDEVAYIAGRGDRPYDYDHARASAAGEVLLGLTNLSFVPVGADEVTRAQALLSRFPVRPRDSLHAATAILHAGGAMVTLDADFERLEGVRLLALDG